MRLLVFDEKLAPQDQPQLETCDWGAKRDTYEKAKQHQAVSPHTPWEVLGHLLGHAIHVLNSVDNIGQ